VSAGRILGTGVSRVPHEQAFLGFVRRASRHVHRRIRRLAHFGHYYIYHYRIPPVDGQANRPLVDHLEVHVIKSRSDIACLVAAGYEDPRVKVVAMDRRLAAGAVAVCGYISRQFAYVGWTATTLRAKQSFDRLPYDVAFDEGEAATGGAWTAPAFRGLGLYRYMFGRELDYLRCVGRTSCSYAIAVGNVASQSGQAIYCLTACARARSMRVLSKRWWTEQPVSGPCPSLSRWGRLR